MRLQRCNACGGARCHGEGRRDAPARAPASALSSTDGGGAGRAAPRAGEAPRHDTASRPEGESLPPPLGRRIGSSAAAASAGCVGRDAMRSRGGAA